MDHIYCKYNNLVYSELQQAVKHHDLDNDEDVVALQNVNKAYREKLKMKAQALAKAKAAAASETASV